MINQRKLGGEWQDRRELKWYGSHERGKIMFNVHSKFGWIQSKGICLFDVFIFLFFPQMVSIYCFKDRCLYNRSSWYNILSLWPWIELYHELVVAYTRYTTKVPFKYKACWNWSTEGRVLALHAVVPGSFLSTPSVSPSSTKRDTWVESQD